MAGSKTQLDQFIADEINRYRGIAYPARTSLLRRMMVRKMAREKLHPNPEDEFCDPEIGPNYEIISQYAEQIATAKREHRKNCFNERLTVERMHPDGYMLLNGHHRWGAAVRMNYPVLPVKIVNLTTIHDVKKMIKGAQRHKRVSFDLDEVIFPGENGTALEEPLRFPLERFFPERLRLGCPALFRFFHEHDYDIWVYSAQYFSTDYLRRYFQHYGVNLDGIVTGLVAHRPGIAEIRETLSSLTKEKYPRSIHIDARSVLCIDRQERKFQEYELSGNPETWSREIMDFVSEYEKARNSH